MRRLPFCLAILVLLAATALLAACNDKSESPETDKTQQAEREYDLDETAQAAAGLLGGDAAAAYVVLAAYDSGYSPYQIAQAIDAGSIDESGAIEGVTPASPASSTPPATATLSDSESPP